MLSPHNTKLRTKWSTPDYLIDRVRYEVGKPVTFDLCAEWRTAKAAKWLGPDHRTKDRRDAFRFDRWEHIHEAKEGILWCNPPFAGMGAWWDLASKHAHRFHGGLVFLAPPKTDQAWFHRAHNDPDVSLCLLTPRIAFDAPEGIAESSPTGPVLLLHKITGRDAERLPPTLDLTDEARAHRRARRKL